MVKPMSQSSTMLSMYSDTKNHKFWKEDADKVCDDEEDISGKIAIVTGSNGGIGKYVAMELAKRGAVVVMAVRNLQKGQEALDEIKKKIGEEAKVDMMKIDMGDMQSIRDFVDKFQSKYSHLNILVNNAGIFDTRPEKQMTKDGYEQHVGVNHLGPFLLTRLLLPSLQKGAPSRIVGVEATLMVTVTMDPEDLLLEKSYRKGNMGMDQYSASKLMGSICMRKLASTLSTSYPGVKLMLLCPGVAKTELGQYEGIIKKVATVFTQKLLGITPHEAAETIILCSVAKSVVNTPESGRGEYYRFTKIWEAGNKYLSEQIANEELTTKLYNLSETAVGLKKN